MIRELRPDASGLPIEVEEFLSWMASERGRSKNTLTAYRRDLAMYSEWLDEQGIDVQTVRREQLDTYVNHRRAGGAAVRSSRRSR